MNFRSIVHFFVGTSSYPTPQPQDGSHANNSITPTALETLTNSPRESSLKLTERSISRSPSPTSDIDDADFECEMIPLEFMLQEVRNKRATDAVLAANAQREMSMPGPGCFSDGDTYKGEMQDNIPNGHGTLTKPNGEIYIGTFQNGSLYGPGRAILANKLRYMGNFTNGWRFDKCGIVYRDDFLNYTEIYRGGLAFNYYHGIGKEIYDGGAIYEGEFVNGEQTGHCKFTFANGDVYEGNFVNGAATGRGKCTYANGDIYEGAFVNGLRTGQGKYIYAEGDIYEGPLVNGVSEGCGKYTYANGDVLEGPFVNGQVTGYGKYRYADGDVYEGSFVNGEQTGHGKFTYNNGDVYEGTFINGKRIGCYKYTDASGRIFRGQIEMNVRSIFRHFLGTALPPQNSPLVRSFALAIRSLRFSLGALFPYRQD